MTRAALPQNYQISAGTLLEDFESGFAQDLGWGTVTHSTDYVKTGTKSLKIVSSTGASAMGIGKKTIALDLSSYDKMTVWFYVPDLTNFKRISFYLSSSTTFATYFSVAANVQTGNGYTGVKQGWNKLVFSRADWTNTGGESWSNQMVRMRVYVYATGTDVTTTAYIDNMTFGGKSIGNVLLTFDDGYDDVYTDAYPYMAAKGLKGTAYIPGSLIGGTGFMTVEQLTTLYAAGWAISNHTFTHSNMGAYSQAQAYAEIEAGRQWLINNGFPRAADHVCYPNGAYNSDVLLAMTQAGAKTGRTIGTWRGQNDLYPYELNVVAIDNNTSLATAKTYIDDVINKGETIIIYLHKLVVSPSVGTEWSIANFQGLIDYIVQKKIRALTIDEWFEGLTNPRYRSIPLIRS